MMCTCLNRRKMLLLMIGLCVVNMKLLDRPEHIIVGMYVYDVYIVMCVIDIRTYVCEILCVCVCVCMLCLCVCVWILPTLVGSSSK